MDQLAKFEFNVDEQYENEKGVFRVISIHRDDMVIRWKNGEEILTKIDLQRRIAERRQREKDEQSTASEPPSKSPLTRGKTVFPGFAPTDFKKSASGTTWRSRNQLGTAVTQKIDTTRFKFNSWAFGNKPEMHIQDIKHHSSAAADYQARFFVRVDQHALYYGFHVARPDNKSGASNDWNASSSWLNQEENEEILHTIALKDNLTVCNLRSPSLGTLLASDDGWHTDESARQPGKEALTTYINDGSETGPFDLQLAATIDKSDAVARGRDIAADIAQLFTRLLPLYQAAVTY